MFSFSFLDDELSIDLREVEDIYEIKYVNKIELNFLN